MYQNQNAASDGCKFERIEKKFRMNKEQYLAMLPVLESNMEPDSHGESTVCSIYYDTPDFLLIRRSMERPLFKEKLRLRSYGFPGEEDAVFVEIKRKLNGVGYKRRAELSFADAKSLLSGETPHCREKQICSEISELAQRYALHPAALIACRRSAYYAKEDAGLRVTLDRDLSYALEGLEHPKCCETKPVITDDRPYVLEIKAMNGIPSWLGQAMSALGIYQAPFSKIGCCFENHITAALFSSMLAKPKIA